MKFLAERHGSGDGEREVSMTRQMPYEPLPASVLFASLVRWCHLRNGDVADGGARWQAGCLPPYLTQNAEMNLNVRGLKVIGGVATAKNGRLAP